jgi:predicted kinase
MLAKNFLDSVYKKHLLILKNLEVPHKKLLICFSGIPGSGKTYISKILEKRYSAVRLNNDNIRAIMKRIDKTSDLDKDLAKYLNFFWTRYKFPNELVILDCGIDRKYKEIFDFAKKNKFRIFVIRIESSRKFLDERIFERNKCADLHYQEKIDRWTKEWREFGKNCKSDITIKNENNLNLNSVFEKLDKLVK